MGLITPNKKDCGYINKTGASTNIILSYLFLQLIDTFLM